jgi:ATP-dependent DNA helicase RecG
MASTALEKLFKILRLEQDQGFRNRAVIGGLESFAEIWLQEALAQSKDDGSARWAREVREQLVRYTNADQTERVEMVKGILIDLEASSEVDRPQGPTRQEPAPAAPPRRPAPRKPTPSPVVAEHEAPPPPSSPPAPPVRTSTGLDASVTTLPGISTAYASRLENLGIRTVADLLNHFPHRYDDYSTLKPIDRLEYGEETTVIGVIWETNTRTVRGGKTIVSSIIADGSGTIEAVWFNQPYLVRQLRAGRRIVLSGKVDEYRGRLVLQSPTWEPLEAEQIHTARLVPIYPLTQGISPRWMRRLMKRVVDHWAPRLEDYLPESLRERAGLADLADAIQQIHFPDSQQSAEDARHRLAFDEFLFIQLGMLQQRRKWQSREGVPIPCSLETVETFLKSLPFELTEAQRRSVGQVVDDLTRACPMSRMLQGDVGSGKTVVAAVAALCAVAAGKQVALMAPTEILAEQHHRTITELLSGVGDLGLGRPACVVLLTGSLRRVERGKVYTALASGDADIVVGTHALIQQHVTFKDLALVIVDEQHRFGVAQRAALRGKGSAAHVLVMSATPIPRSLALTLYGDLDISVIDELPPGRKPIETRWLLPGERERAYTFLRSQIEKGRQAFVLYPLIEESEKLDARAAAEEYERLQQDVFPDLEIGLLHGKMKAGDKDEVMARFRQGEISILVCTSVVEVGIDVPNASIMLIEGADRFGLAQLHQFRGRVGRGTHKSYCLLVSDTASPDDPQTRATWERLRAIEETQDGFVLAEKDLELRGPGDFLGVRQSGMPALRLASLGNIRVLEQARSEAQSIFRSDPSLSSPEHLLLKEQMKRFWQWEGDLS